MRVSVSRTVYIAFAVLCLGTHTAFAAGDRPEVPGNLQAAVNDNRIVITWDEPADDEGVAGYNVYRDNQYLTTVLDTRYEGELDTAVVQTFNIIAFDQIPRNFSRPSETVFAPENLVPEDTTIPPSVPQGLQGSIDGNTVSLTWQASTDDEAVRGYNVYQNNTYLTSVATPDYQGRVTPGQIYTYYVVAVDTRINFSARSESLSLPDTGPVDTSSPPGVPTNLAADVQGSDAGLDVRLSWNEAADDRGISGYNIYINGSYRRTVFDTQYRETIGANERVGYSIVAFDIDGNFSPRSPELTVPETNAQATPDSPSATDTAPAAPQQLTGTVRTGTDSDTVTLEWAAASDDQRVAGYNVYVNDRYTNTVFTTRYTTDVESGSINSFYVVAFDGSNNFSTASESVVLPDNGNRPPFFVNFDDQRIEVGPQWELVIEPRDPDGGVPGLFIGNLPTGMRSVDNLNGTRSLLWQPLQPDVGNYEIRITAFDSQDQSIRTIKTLSLEVVLPEDRSTIPNRPPTIDAIPDHVVRTGDPIVLQAKAVDANGTVPDLVLLNPPTGSTFTALETDPRIRELRFQVAATERENIELNFRATDADDPSLVATSSTTLDVRQPQEFERSGERLKTLAAQAGIQIGYASLLLINSKPDAALYKDIAAAEFDLVTAENSMKWGYINPQPGVYRWDDADELVRFAADNGMQVHGHALVWYTQLPQWVQQSAVSERESLMNDFIDTMMARYSDVDIWDVVNEAFEDDGSYRNSVWFQAMGEEHIDKAFRRARAADPDAVLIYNDYDVAAGGDKSDAMYTMVQRLMNNGVPIDGVGFQMHVDTNFTDFAAVRDTFQRFADLGVDIYITELDVNLVGDGNEQDQAVVFAETVSACLAQPACKAVQTWGFTDRYTWRRPNTPLLLDRNYQPKPAYTALQRALAGERVQSVD